jgi:hypothetical protein
MKKLLVAFAVAMFASTANAYIAGSSHDFLSVSTGFMTTAPVHACRGCHQPHGGSTDGALWAQGNFSTIAVQAFSGGGDLTVASNISGIKTCLSCHASSVSTLAKPLATADVGTDLRNDHPVGDTIVLGSGSSWVTNPVIGGRTVTNGVSALTCRTCHDPHNGSAGFPATRYLIKFTTATDICAACHIK